MEAIIAWIAQFIDLYDMEDYNHSIFLAEYKKMYRK